MIRKDVVPFLKTVEKPARYTGGEFGQTVKNKAEMAVRFAFCFPDLYEIGMSNLGIRILYDVLNRERDIWCERCFAPWPDMEKAMRENGVPLYALESGDALTEFDFVGFTLQYEGSYTNVLYMLDLAGIPFYAKDRNENWPILLAGGPCTYNAEPVADFFDLICIGEGEEALIELMDLYRECKAQGTGKKTFLYRAATELEGFYVPSLYEFRYREDGTIREILREKGAPETVKKRIVKDFDKAPFPVQSVVPYLETVHDRAVIEVFRGCLRGCRFCQAGMIYRPVRERSAETLDRLSRQAVEYGGYDEIALSSLSISDYTCLPELTDRLTAWTDEERINLSLPSLRLDSFTKELMDKVMGVRKSGLTFAPEAGTQRLRDVINKGVTEEDLLRAAAWSFSTGRTNIKLYFMMGLPYETDEDIKGIAALSQKVVNAYYASPDKPKGKSVTVTISLANFVPKPFTPFQWEPQDTLERLTEKQALLGASIATRKIRYTWHDAKVSRVEAILAKGDRRLSAAIVNAYESGQRFDAWGEFFRYDRWMQAIEKAGLSPEFYANRRMGYDEILPWDLIDIGVTKAFLIRENERAGRGQTTPQCRESCSGCGAFDCEVMPGGK